MPCFYTPQLNKNSESIVINDSEFHHIARVFRKKINDTIALTSGNGIFAKGIITSISNKEVSVSIIEKEFVEQSSPRIAVAFSLLKNKNDYLIVEKLTELGVKEFFPFYSDRTIKKYSDKTAEKFHKTAITAIKQCDNAFIPTTNKVSSLAKTINIAKEKGYDVLIASEIIKGITIRELLTDKNFCLVIGPEGGFSDAEFELFAENDSKMFSLGNHVVRAETAAISATAQAVNCLLTDNKNYY